MVFEAIDSDDSPIECEIASPDKISTTMPPTETSGVEDLDAIDEGPSDDDEETFREPSSYECRIEKLVEYGYVDALELDTTFPESQPYLRTRKRQKKAARKLRQATKLATTEDATLGNQPVKSVESTTYTKTRSEPIKSVVIATHSNPVDPVISYTEAARDIINMQLYLMIWG